MKYEETIKEIQGIITDWFPSYDPNNDWERYTITLNMAAKALEKQIPKKPSFEHTAFGECQSCENPIDGYKPAYCCVCGQRLDWSDI